MVRVFKVNKVVVSQSHLNPEPARLVFVRNLGKR